MIKSFMDLLDVLFPIKLGPLTYRCPEEFSAHAEPGMIVSAPLKNRLVKGVIMGKTFKTTPGDMKDIQKVHGNFPILSNTMITLLIWMSEYYLTGQGVVLKNMVPKEAFTRVKPRKTKTREGKRHPLNLIDINEKSLPGVIESIQKNDYRAFLLHAPSSLYEYSFVMKILAETGNAILLIPEVSQIDTLYTPLKERFGERVCLFHGGLSKGKRSEAIERILSGSSDIVLGTRSAVFAPLKKVSFISVLHEHSSPYKQEEGMCYNGRDVAVMRGYLEKATVLLSSISPSIESLYNCRTGKYTFIKTLEEMKKPRIRVIDMKQGNLLKPYLSKSVVDASKRYIQNDKKVMFVINRRGYSTLLQCTECHYIEECPHCNIPLVLHKQDSTLKCHYCGYTSEVPERCRRCKSYAIELLGAGTQRVQEDIEELLGVKTLRLDSDRARKKSEIESVIGATYKNDVRIIVGTKLMARRLGPESSSGSPRFSMAALLNTDLLINLPDFRSAEKAFQEISALRDMIDPHGEIFIQTRIPQNYLFRYVKRHDYYSFFQEELSRRKPLNYPPFSRLLLIKIISKRDLSEELSGIIGKIERDVQILGPFQAKRIRKRREFRVLLKSPLRWSLHAAARRFTEAFKEAKDVIIRVDVDPITM